MKTKSKTNTVNWAIIVYLLFFKSNVFSQSECIPSKVEFRDYISKMKLDVRVRTNDTIERVNLTIFDINENVTINTTNIKIIDSFIQALKKSPLTHADKTLITIQKFTNNMVSITHVNANTAENNNPESSIISYMTEIEKAIDNAHKGDILFLIFSYTEYFGPKEMNPEKLKLFKKAIGKGLIVIESAGNDNSNIATERSLAIAFPNMPTIVVGGAIPENNEYRVAKCSNYGEVADVYGPSGIAIRNDTLFHESSSGSTVIAAMAVRLQYECKSSPHKFLDAQEMKNIFTKANSSLKVIENGGTTKKIPQYDELLKYARAKYFIRERRP